MNPILWTEIQTAEFLAVAVKMLQAWRVRGSGPKFIKLGRCVRYSKEALLEFLAEHTMSHTEGK